MDYNQKMPEFDELNDRMIAEASSSPKIVIKTNLDNKENSEQNPYKPKSTETSEQFDEFFKEK